MATRIETKYSSLAFPNNPSANLWFGPVIKWYRCHSKGIFMPTLELIFSCGVLDNISYFVIFITIGVPPLSERNYALAISFSTNRNNVDVQE